MRDEVHLLSDGRFSSPGEVLVFHDNGEREKQFLLWLGHTAFYGQYTLMDDKTKAIIHAEVIQCGETTSSQAMELETAKRCLHWWDSTFENSPKSICTDRHGQIQKFLRTNYPQVSIRETNNSVSSSLCPTVEVSYIYRQIQKSATAATSEEPDEVERRRENYYFIESSTLHLLACNSSTSLDYRHHSKIYHILHHSTIYQIFGKIDRN